MSYVAEQIIEMLASNYSGRTDHANRSALTVDLDEVLRRSGWRSSNLNPQVESAGFEIATKEHYLNLEDGTRLRIPAPIMHGLLVANAPAVAEEPPEDRTIEWRRTIKSYEIELDKVQIVIDVKVVRP